ncbi:tRNA-binding protein [Micromonospora sp. KC207]|uniref:tRNA-binding protein n=1 Tax=Micromonospora sp. KC207 TaxID=2530377 RepID=UPI001043627C|nr:tRNA-binding protein [Micromonospora sp. KC207]TDC60660.1 tRNA-binding protein [Micromonospora sp. KC207]
MAGAAAAVKPQITFGKFQNVDLRVARILSAPMAENTRFPCRMIELDLGPLGKRVSVGQYALIGEDELVGANVVACVNLGEREMGPYVSQALVLGAPHPASPEGQAQAIPIVVAGDAVPGDAIY